MNRHSPHCAASGRKTGSPGLMGLGATVAIALLAALLGGCDNGSGSANKPEAFVRTEIVHPHDRQGSVTQTGEVQARFRADLSFRVAKACALRVH